MAWTTMATKSNGVVIDQGDWNQLVNNFAYLKGQSGTIALESGATLTGSVVPVTTLAYNLGSSSAHWASAFVGTVSSPTSAALNLSANNGAGNGAGYYLIANNSLVAVPDNTQNCGLTGARWAAVYAVNGTIQTSARAAKEGFAAVADADALAAVLATPIQKFRYKKSAETLEAEAQLLLEGKEPEPDVGVEQIGFVAEDAHPMLTLEDGVSVNAQQTASVALAAIRALAARVAVLEGAPQ